MNILKKLFGAKKEKPKHSNEELELAYTHAIEQLEKFKKTAYVPIVIDSKSEFSDKSKFGGYPYLRHENDWPICPNCQKNMQLFLQLNLNEIPENNSDELIQLFYCTTVEPLCESDMEAFFPFSTSVECRKIHADKASSIVSPKIDTLFPEKQITGWTPKDDYPHYEEYAELGISLELEDNVFDLLEERGLCLPLTKDKLFGWPYWIQSVEYSYDRTTESQMNLLFQLDSEDNLPFMFGDMGIGHLTQSSDDPGELAFGWACS